MSVRQHISLIQCAMGVLVGAGLLAYFYAAAWYKAHPVFGKIILAVVGIWAVWQFIQWIKNICDDPLTRIKPRR